MQLPQKRSLRELSGRPFVMEPAGTPAGLWAMGACRQAGYEPDIRYRTTDLQIHLRLVEEQLAVALLPELSGARGRRSTTVHSIEGRPARQIFTAVRRGATNHPRPGLHRGDRGSPEERPNYEH